MSNFRMTRRRAALGLACLPGWTWPSAGAAPPYPTRPVTLVISLQAGSGSDVAGRLIAEHMSKRLGVPMVVENAPGAGGVIGASKIFNARADGYTIGALNNGLACIVPNLKDKPAFNIERLTPIGMVANLPSVLVVTAKLPAGNLTELVAYSKSRPGALSYGSVGLGSPQHIAMEMLKNSSGADLLHVPYRGGPQAVADVVAGQIQATWIAIPVALPFIKSGQLKAIAVGGNSRSSQLGAVPTLREAGVSSFSYLPWIGFFGPPGLPEAITTSLHEALQEALRDTEVTEKLTASGLEAAPMSVAEFARRTDVERQEIAAVVKQLQLD